MTDDRVMATNALHAAECWLQRIGAEAWAVAVVTVLPAAAVGVWSPGDENVGVLPGIDEPAAELAEATAPFVHAALAQYLGGGESIKALGLGVGSRLQVLLMPARREIALRVVGDGKVVVLAALHLLDEVH